MFYGALGLAGALGIFFAADMLVARFFEVSHAMREDTITAFKLAGLGFALTQAQNYLLVVPQALQRYDRSAQSEAFFGILVNLASVAAAVGGGGIVGVIIARVCVSGLNVLFLIWLIRSFDLNVAMRWPRRDVRTSLTSFSAYAYLSKIASTLHQHADKLIVGSIAGPVALTFYTVPVTLAGRILGLTYRISELRPVYLGVTRYVTYINLAALGVIVLAGDEFLRRWVGEEFVTQGYSVLVLMTVALLVDSLTNVPSLVNDALGHPRVTGRFALANGLSGVAMVYLGTVYGGIIGAAGGHLLSSMALGIGFLLFVHGRTVPISIGESLRSGFGRSLAIGAAIICVLVPLKWLVPAGLMSTVAIVSAALLTLGLAGLFFIVSVDERAAMLSMARRLRP
jgi:O-antigen/teichoic acid export membrane protein